MRVLRNRVVASSPTGDTRPLIGETVLGGERVELRRFTNLVPMRNATTGDFDEMPLLAGQGVGLVDAVKSAASVIADLTTGAREALDRYQ
jgi:NAD(P)H-dependent flavin oxidoreductase YrpB (nitropropane dioxygenase family)